MTAIRLREPPTVMTDVVILIGAKQPGYPLRAELPITMPIERLTIRITGGGDFALQRAEYAKARAGYFIAEWLARKGILP